MRRQNRRIQREIEARIATVVSQLTRGWRALELIAGAGLAAALIAFVWSIVPVIPPVDQSVVIGLGVLLFLVWPPTVLWLVAHKDLTKGRYGVWGPASGSVPSRVRWALGALVLVLVLGWLSSLPEILRGNPEQHQSRYFVNNHGSTTQISQSEYLISMAAHDRFASAILTGFFLGVILTLRAGRRSVRDSAMTNGS